MEKLCGCFAGKSTELVRELYFAGAERAARPHSANVKGVRRENRTLVGLERRVCSEMSSLVESHVAGRPFLFLFICIIDGAILVDIDRHLTAFMLRA